jgi:hypothetical protein
MRTNPFLLGWCFSCGFFLQALNAQDQVSITASEDNTLYESYNSIVSRLQAGTWRRPQSLFCPGKVVELDKNLLLQICLDFVY